MMMNAKEPDVGRYDLVLDSSAVSAAFNASIVRALEFDRVLGYEMHAGGTSYLAPPEEVLGQFSYNNPKLNVRATGSAPRAGGMYRWDVEGVAPAEYQLIREGVLVDYFTTREFAPELEWWYRRNGVPVESRGTAGSQGSVLIQVVAPSIAIMDPGEEDVTVDEMIAETENGIYIHRGGFASVDPSMLNMQFSGSGMAHEIRDGKLGEPLNRPVFLASTPDFWRSMDMIGGAGTFAYNSGGTGKGDPFQNIGRTVGAPAARFREIKRLHLREAVVSRPTGKILTREEAEAIAQKVLEFADPSADTIVNVQLSNTQNTRFSRNEITTQLDASLGQVTVTTMMNGKTGNGVTQRFDDDGLMEAVRWGRGGHAGWSRRARDEPPDPAPQLPGPAPSVVRGEPRGGHRGPDRTGGQRDRADRRIRLGGHAGPERGLDAGRELGGAGRLLPQHERLAGAQCAHERQHGLRLGRQGDLRLRRSGRAGDPRTGRPTRRIAPGGRRRWSRRATR